MKLDSSSHRGSTGNLFFMPGRHMCDVGGGWGGGRNVTLPPPYPPTHPPPYPTLVAYTYTSPPLDYPQISMCVSSCLNCLRRLKKNWLDGSLSFCGAGRFRFDDLSVFAFSFIPTQIRSAFSEGKPLEATTTNTRRYFHLLYVRGFC